MRGLDRKGVDKSSKSGPGRITCVPKDAKETEEEKTGKMREWERYEKLEESRRRRKQESVRREGRGG